MKVCTQRAFRRLNTTAESQRDSVNFAGIPPSNDVTRRVRPSCTPLANMATSVVRTRNDKRDANVMGALLVRIQSFDVTNLSVILSVRYYPKTITLIVLTVDGFRVVYKTAITPSRRHRRRWRLTFVPSASTANERVSLGL